MFIITTLIAFLYELVLAIPIIGGSIALATGLGTITTAFVIHIIVLIFRFANGSSKAVPIIAIVLTIFTFIPFVAWFLHVVIALLYFIDLVYGIFARSNNTTNRSSNNRNRRYNN